ncbi:hypothetical protein J437_LFUL007657, partial [Ladona fulva]
MTDRDIPTMFLLPALLGVIIFFLVLPVISILKSWLRVFLMTRKLPGPEGHPIYGHTAVFASKEKFFEKAIEWAKEYNMHKTMILFHPLILLHTPETVQ